MNKVIVTAFCMVAVLVLLMGCGNARKESEAFFVGMANPWMDCADIAEAERLAGFNMKAPERIVGHDRRLIQTIKESTVQLFYSDKDMSEPDSDVVLVRKARGNEDISGDYNTYEKTETVTTHGTEVSLRENGDMVYVATWKKDGFTYAVNADNGLTKEEIYCLAETIE